MVWARTKEVEVYRLGDSADRPASKLADSETLRSVLLPGLELPLSDIFAR